MLQTRQSLVKGERLVRSVETSPELAHYNTPNNHMQNSWIDIYPRLWDQPLPVYSIDLTILMIMLRKRAFAYAAVGLVD